MGEKFNLQANLLSVKSFLRLPQVLVAQSSDPSYHSLSCDQRETFGHFFYPSSCSSTFLTYLQWKEEDRYKNNNFFTPTLTLELFWPKKWVKKNFFDLPLTGGGRQVKNTKNGIQQMRQVQSLQFSSIHTLATLDNSSNLVIFDSLDNFDNIYNKYFGI